MKTHPNTSNHHNHIQPIVTPIEPTKLSRSKSSIPVLTFERIHSAAAASRRDQLVLIVGPGAGEVSPLRQQLLLFRRHEIFLLQGADLL